MVAARREDPVKAVVWSVESLGLFTQAVIQGAFVLAKAHNDPAVAAECLTHLRRYLETQLPAVGSREGDLSRGRAVLGGNAPARRARRIERTGASARNVSAAT